MKNLDLIKKITEDIIKEHNMDECEFNDSYVHIDPDQEIVLVSIIAKNGFLIDVVLKEKDLIVSTDSKDINEETLRNTVQQSISDGIRSMKDILFDQLKTDGYYDPKGLVEDKDWFDKKVEELNLI